MEGESRWVVVLGQATNSQTTSHSHSSASIFLPSFSLSFRKPSPLSFFFPNVACTEDHNPLVLSRNIESHTSSSQLCCLLLIFLSAAHAVWFQTPITHKYHVVGVGFGRIASAIQDSVSGGKVPCEMAFFAALRRANVSLMPLLPKTRG